MKKILSIFLFIVVAVGAMAQSTSPRFGTSPNSDNTGRALTYRYATLTDGTGADSVVLNTRAWENIYIINLKDSLTLKTPITTRAYLGDQITLIATATTGTPKLKFAGSTWITQGEAELSTGLRAVIRLIFDGAKWVEVSRAVM